MKPNKNQPGKFSQRTSMGVDLFVSPIFWYRSFSVSACVCVCVCVCVCIRVCAYESVNVYKRTCVTQDGRGKEIRITKKGGREGGKEGGREEGRERGRKGGRETGRKEKGQSALTLRPCQGRLPLKKYINMCPSASRSSRLLCSGRQDKTSHYGLVSTCQSSKALPSRHLIMVLYQHVSLARLYLDYM